MSRTVTAVATRPKIDVKPEWWDNIFAPQLVPGADHHGRPGGAGERRGVWNLHARVAVCVIAIASFRHMIGLRAEFWRYDGRDAEFRPGENWRDAYRSAD